MLHSLLKGCSLCPLAMLTMWSRRHHNVARKFQHASTMPTRSLTALLRSGGVLERCKSDCGLPLWHLVMAFSRMKTDPFLNWSLRQQMPGAMTLLGVPTNRESQWEAPPHVIVRGTLNFQFETSVWAVIFAATFWHTFNGCCPTSCHFLWF